MFSRSVAWLAIVLPVTAAEKPAQKAPADLEGTWKLDSFEMNGHPLNLRLEPILVIKGTSVRYAGEEIARLNADATTTPRTLDLTFLGSKQTFEGIYAVDKDSLKICLNGRSESVKERPQEFSTADKENLRLLIFRRVEAREGEGTGGARGYVGVALRMEKEKEEVIVQDVIEGSPAKKAGLMKDDVVLKVHGGETKDLLSAVDAVRQTKPGAEVVFRVRRDGKEKDITVKAGVLSLALLFQLE